MVNNSPFNPNAQAPTPPQGGTIADNRNYNQQNGWGLHDKAKTGTGWFGGQTTRDELAHHRQMQLRADDQYREDTAMDRSFEAMRRNGVNPLSTLGGSQAMQGIGSPQQSQGSKPTGNGSAGIQLVTGLLQAITGIVGSKNMASKLQPTANAVADATNKTILKELTPQEKQWHTNMQLRGYKINPKTGRY